MFKLKNLLFLLLYFSFGNQLHAQEETRAEQQIAWEKIHKVTADSVVTELRNMFAEYQELLRTDALKADSLKLQRQKIDSLLMELENEHTTLMLNDSGIDSLRAENDILKALMLSYVNQKDSINIDSEKKKEIEIQDRLEKIDLAKNFLNQYVQEAEKLISSEELRNWVYANDEVSEDFKSALRLLVQESNNLDPIMGLDFDPIIDAQDLPEAHFVFFSTDFGSNKMLFKTISEPSFEVTIRIEKMNDKWVVDGCGVINLD